MAFQTVPRPTQGGAATVTLTNLQPGTLTATAAAFPNPDATGVALAAGSTPLTIQAGQTTPFTITMVSTVAKITVTPATITGTVGSAPVQLAATLLDASGNMVLASQAAQFVSSNTSVATVDTNARVTLVGPGTATITATEVDSGKMTTVSVTVSPPGIKVGSSPGALALNPVTGRLYVDNADSTVSVVDTTTNQVVTTTAATGVSLGVNSSSGFVADSVANKVYLRGEFDLKLAVIDGATNNFILTPASNGVDDIDVNPMTKRLYLSGDVLTGAGFVDATMLTSTTMMAPVTMLPGTNSSNAFFVTVNPTTNRVYVANSALVQPAPFNLLVFNGANNTLIATVPLSAGPLGHPVVNQTTNRIYIPTGTNVIVVDGSSNSVVGTAATTAVALAVDPSTNKIYGATGAGVDVIDGATNTVTTLPLPSGVTALGQNGIAVNPNTHKVYVTDGVNTVFVLQG